MMVLLSFLLLTMFLCTLASSPTPPLFVKQPPSNEIYIQKDTPLTLQCEATGEPKPKYNWIKNGKPFDLEKYKDRITSYHDNGSLTFQSPEDPDVGQYQCFAENEFGIAMSNSVFIRNVRLDSFPSTTPITVEVDEGNHLNLSCTPPQGTPKPKLVWLLINNEGVKSFNDSRITLDPEGTLWFSSVILDDSSNDFMYTCAATSILRTEYKIGHKVLLKVNRLDKPILEKGPEPLYVTSKVVEAQVGENVELYCIFSGKPVPNVKWFKNGRIVEEDRIYFNNFDKTLVINDAILEDQGNYTCVVNNEVGVEQSHTIEVHINAKPYFTIEPKIQNLIDDDTAKIHCEASGFPEPKITWIYNGKPIKESTFGHRKNVSENKFIIKNVKKTDTGNYGCNATNHLGYAYKEIYIRVLALPPEIHEPPTNKTAVVKKHTTLTCRTFGAPTPTIEWFLNEEKLTGNRYIVHKNGNLEIKHLKFQDSGKYICRATNKIGSMEMAAYLKVIGISPKIIKHPNNKAVLVGNSTHLACRASGLPDPVIKWNREGMELTGDKRFSLDKNGDFKIRNVSFSDAGIYTCQASNEFGEGKTTAYLKVMGNEETEIEEDIYSQKVVTMTKEIKRIEPISSYSNKFSSNLSILMVVLVLKSIFKV